MGFGGMSFGGGGAGGGGGGPMRGLQALLGQPSPEAEALQKAVDANASAAEVKDMLAKYRELKQRKQDALLKAQNELRQVLTPRQEAVMVLMGLLD
jgi:Spy/CpxP family protein refolding chaperone